MCYIMQEGGAAPLAAFVCLESQLGQRLIEVISADVASIQRSLREGARITRHLQVSMYSYMYACVHVCV